MHPTLQCAKLLVVTVSMFWVNVESIAEEVDPFLSNVRATLSAENSGAPEFEEVRAAAFRRDQRLEKIESEIDLVSLASRNGRSWPNPELRLGIEDDEGDIESGLALRIRFPEGVNRRVVEETAEIELARLSKRKTAIEKNLELEIRKSVAMGAIARSSMLLELENCERQQVMLKKLTEQIQPPLLTEAKLRRKLRSATLRLKQSYLVFKESLLVFQRYGLSELQAIAFVSREGDTVTPRFGSSSDLTRYQAVAIELSVDCIDSERDEGLVLVQQEFGQRNWFLIPTFAQVGWEEDKDGLLSGDSGDFQIRAGVEINLFDRKKGQELESIRRKATVELAEARSHEIREVKSTFWAYSELNSWFPYAQSEREDVLERLLSLEENVDAEELTMENRSNLYEEIYYVQRSELDDREQLWKAYFALCDAVGQVL